MGAISGHECQRALLRSLVALVVSASGFWLTPALADD